MLRLKSTSARYIGTVTLCLIKLFLYIFFILGVRKSKVTQFLKESTGRDGFSRVGAAKILEVRSASLNRYVPKLCLQRNADSDIGDAAQINA